MDLKFKIAEITDIETLVEVRMTVLKTVFNLPADTCMDEVRLESRLYYNERISDGSHLAVLVYDGDKAVGSGGICFYRVMPSFHDPKGICAYIMNMYTDPAYRGKGVAGRTLGILVKAATDRGIQKITLETTGMARSLYHRFGFVEMEDEMEYRPGKQE